MKEELNIPPGIIALRNPENDKQILTFEDNQQKYAELYRDWVYNIFSVRKFIIHTIEVNGQRFSVGDKTNKGTIERLYYHAANTWCAHLDNDDRWFIDLLTKLPSSQSNKSGEEFDINHTPIGPTGCLHSENEEAESKFFDYVKKATDDIQPSEAPSVTKYKTKEEILKKYFTPTGFPENYTTLGILEAMEEYKSQFDTPIRLPDNETGWNVASLFGYNDQNVCDLLNEYEAKLKSMNTEEYSNAPTGFKSSDGRDLNYPTTSDPYITPGPALQRLIAEYQKHGSLFIGFDFDGTVHDYHKKGYKFPFVISLLRDLKAIGCKLICWTAYQNLDFVNNYLVEHRIPFDAINEGGVNMGYESKKPFFNALLDDRSGLDSVYRDLKALVEYLKN